MAGVYIHIPFCKQACSYCDFYFVTQPEYLDKFVKQLSREIEQYENSFYAKQPVQTIYIGGGTPSLLSAGHLESIFKALDRTFELHPTEITIELNPDDVSMSYLASIRDLGVNRASMGVQTFQPELLTFMNRAHTHDEALKSLERLKEADFYTFTVDLIYGNPGQSAKELGRDLDLLLAFDPPHISAYSLTIEPRTRLGKKVELGRLVPPADEDVAEQMDLLTERLEDRSLHRYEVSNFSRPGCEAVHNSRYWTHENYLGFGPAAHSFWWQGKYAACRRANPGDLRSYLYDFDSYRPEEEKLDLFQLAEERIMLAMRTRKGISKKELADRYEYRWSQRQEEYLETKKREGKIQMSQDGTVRPTNEGMNMADAITLDLLTLH